METHSQVQQLVLATATSTRITNQFLRKKRERPVQFVSNEISCNSSLLHLTGNTDKFVHLSTSMTSTSHNSVSTSPCSRSAQQMASHLSNGKHNTSLHLNSRSEQYETAVVSSRLLPEPLPPALAMHWIETKTFLVRCSSQHWNRATL